MTKREEGLSTRQVQRRKTSFAFSADGLGEGVRRYDFQGEACDLKLWRVFFFFHVNACVGSVVGIVGSK